MKIITIYNHKGGIGKTVTAANFAYNLVAAGKRVLIVDLDPQGNLSSFFRRYDLNKPSVTEVLVLERPISRCIVRTNYKGLDILPSNLRLRKVRDVEGVEKNFLKSLKEQAKHYDYCIVDCPPSVDVLMKIAVRIADDILVPLKPDRFSSDGLGSVLDLIREYGKQLVTVGCLFTQFYRQRDALKAIRGVMETNTVLVYENVIRRCAAVDHSIQVRKPLARCASRSTAALDYADFTKEYLEREGKGYGIVKGSGNDTE